MNESTGKELTTRQLNKVEGKQFHNPETNSSFYNNLIEGLFNEWMRGHRQLFEENIILCTKLSKKIKD